MSRRPFQRRPRALAGLALTALSLFALGGCGDEATDAESSALGAQGMAHVHGLGLNPADGDLYVATHSGLFRAAEGSAQLERVGESLQDTMGFTVVGPDQFLGSGHPAPGEPGPTSLGLIESGDGGETWEGISLSGEADFHILRFAGDRIYGYDALNNLLSVSEDGGKTRKVSAPPAPLIDLAVDPEDPERLLASSERGLSISTDSGKTWRPIDRQIGLLAWPTAGTVFLIDAGGSVQRADDPEAGWQPLGKIGGQPAALTAVDDRDLYAALADATLVRSTDGGVSWEKFGG